MPDGQTTHRIISQEKHNRSYAYTATAARPPKHARAVAIGFQAVPTPRVAAIDAALLPGRQPDMDQVKKTPRST